ncbi:MAG: hypothetical protein K2I07_00775 [Lachnospiraceae bacterium]|nr:hypothetical protein [Lachnospiraceae bacterium]
MKKATGINYIILAMLAFACLGLEVVLAFWIEPIIWGSQINEWTDLQTIIHWVVTCSLWGVASCCIILFAKKKYNFDLFQKGNKMAVWQWALVVIFVIGSLIFSYFDWNGSKVIKEFYANGFVKFIFQYIYYIFETVLVTLILVFGQNAFEKWFHKRNIPYGGIIVATTWGAVHFFTKDISGGIVTVIAGLAFGSVYLIVNRDIRKAYPILWIMFVM